MQICYCRLWQEDRAEELLLEDSVHRVVHEWLFISHPNPYLRLLNVTITDLDTFLDYSRSISDQIKRLVTPLKGSNLKQDPEEEQ